MNDKEAAGVVRTFLCSQSIATLCTVSVSCEQYPFGSIVPYDIDARGNLLIFISLISEHYKNISADPRVSLLIADRFGHKDPQAHARATFIGDADAVPGEELEATRESYWKRFPFAPERAIAHNFLFYRISATRIRWIGGFGNIRWISPGDYGQTTHDPVAYESKPIIDHMNEDHRDALRELLQFHQQVEVPEDACTMTAVDANGFTVDVKNSEKSESHRLPFVRSAQSAADVRTLFIESLKQARESKN